MNGNPPEGNPANVDQCEQATRVRLEQERDRLHQEVARLRVERDQLAKALLTLLPAEPGPPEEEILARLAQLGKEQSLEEYIHEVFKEVGG
jgi:chorismate mutase